MRSGQCDLGNAIWAIVLLTLCLAGCNDTTITIDPEDGGITVIESDGSLPSVPACPSENEVAGGTLFAGGDAVDEAIFANGVLSLTLFNIDTSGGTPYIANVGVKFQEDGDPLPLPVEWAGGQIQGGEIAVTLCVRWNGTVMAMKVILSFDLVTSAKLVYSVGLCEDESLSGECDD